MLTSFALAVCAEMNWLDGPIDGRCARLVEMGYRGTIGMGAFVKGDLEGPIDASRLAFKPTTWRHL